MGDRGSTRIMQALVFAMTLAIATRAEAGGANVVVTIENGNKAKAEITAGAYTAEFELEFETENLQNLTVACIGISADVLDATEQADINARLPHTTQHVDTDFPIRVTVTPPPSCGLEFQDQYEVSLDTPNLVYAPYSKYRLVKAPIGGAFAYVTGSVTSGSVRTRGRAGGFSEFVVVRDDAPTPAYYQDCVDQYDLLEARLDDAAISPTARHTLEIDLALSRAAYDAHNYADAVALLAAFDQHCTEYGGAALPNRWRSAGDLDNIEGDLVGHTNNLRFLMNRLEGNP